MTDRPASAPSSGSAQPARDRLPRPVLLVRRHALQILLIAATVLPLVYAVTRIGSTDAFVSFVIGVLRGYGFALAVVVHVGFVLTARVIFTRQIVPRGVAIPAVGLMALGILVLDGDLLGATDWLYAQGAASGWAGVAIVGAVLVIVSAALFVWLSYQLARVVAQPKVWRRFRRHRLAMVSLGVLVLLVGVALSYSLIDPSGRAYQQPGLDTGLKFAPPGTDGLILGGDELGRDVALRLLRGARVSLAVGLIASTLAALIGTIIGALAGFYGGWIDTLLMRLVDMMLSLPVIAVMIVLAAVNPTKLLAQAFEWHDPRFLGLQLSIWNIILIVVIFGWMTVARLVRGEVLKQKAETYVESARALGFSDTRILWGHIIPNCMAPIIVATTLSVGGIILYETALSFLGLGIQPPEVSWGKMVQEGGDLTVMRQFPRLAVLPGLCILITVVAFNFLGDGLRDALDPRHVTDRQG